MSGTVTVTNTGDWLTPYVVEVAIEGRPPSTSKFAAPARAQEYVLKMADSFGLTKVYDLDAAPRRKGPVTAEEFAARVTRVCAKCRTAKPIADFRVLRHTNRTDGRTVHHGWADRCLKCEAEHGQ